MQEQGFKSLMEASHFIKIAGLKPSKPKMPEDQVMAFPSTQDLGILCTPSR
jgi:hypothetical protein